MGAFTNLVEVPVYTNIKQQRLHILCILRLPDEVREVTPQVEVKQCHGNFLIGFSLPPKKGEIFPYESQFWRLIDDPIQFPSRYKSRKKKKPAVAYCEWVGKYESEEDIFNFIFEWRQANS